MRESLVEALFTALCVALLLGAHAAAVLGVQATYPHAETPDP